MIYLRYLLYFIPSLLVTLLCWLTNPLVCLFPSRQPNGRDKLWGIFELWSTYDNYCDEGYYSNYFGAPTPQGHYDYDHSAWLRYTYRLKWLSRNTGYGWSYLLFSIPKGTGFQWKGLSKTYFGYYNDFNIGWRDHATMPKLDLATRIIGIRKST
jgi:hypothetical protein